jgi:creatinine amidohydrolase
MVSTIIDAMLCSGHWWCLTSRDFALLDAERTVAVLPVAAVEQHGAHLPLATDAVINEGIVDGMLMEVADDADLCVLVLPAQNVGDSLEHTAFPGTLSVQPEQLIGLWTDIGRSVSRAGVRKLVIFNSHGGQVPEVDIVARRLRAELEMLVVRASYFDFGTPPGLVPADERAHGIHGGQVETSMILHLRPELVRQDGLRDYAGLPLRMAGSNELLGPEKPIGFGWMAQDIHAAGVSGNAGAADAMRGAELLGYLAQRLATLVREVAEVPLSALKGPDSRD